jgi:hypothetical protein
MEINLITKEGITPNPTVEFLELCQKALDYIASNNFNDLLELESKFTDLFKEDTLTSLEKRWDFGRLSINIVYANRGEGIQHRFISHYDNISNCPSNYGELNPVIFAY